VALIKDIQLPNGISINYWRIVRIEISVESNNTEVHIVGYLTKEARQENKSFVEVKSFHIPPLQIESMEQSGNNPYNLAYEALKNEPFFNGAKDD
jgi:hypothetical protein